MASCRRFYLVRRNMLPHKIREVRRPQKYQFIDTTAVIIFGGTGTQKKKKM